MESLFMEIVKEVRLGTLNIHNYHENDVFIEFGSILMADVEKFPKYTLDGRYEKICFDELKYAANNELNYSAFLNRIEKSLEALSVPCMIVVPLNYLKDTDIPNDMILSDNIRLFKTDKNTRKHSIRKINNKSQLEVYFESTVYANLLRDHILMAKDKSFFNFPILTILINNVDWRVEIESGRIVSAVYSFIRMIEFNIKLDDGGWGYLLHCAYYPAKTYGVYYNDEYTSPDPPYNDGYGYSLRFQCSPILDISTKEFINNKSHMTEFTTLLSRFINYCFHDGRLLSASKLSKIKKWQNAILMYNSAYENASVEKYDNALIMLLVILESLFISNTGNKKEKVINALINFFHGDQQFGEGLIRQLITGAYNLRNKFVHEGAGIDNEYIYFKSLSNYQGMVTGMKPFVHLEFGIMSKKCKQLQMLFVLVGQVLRTYSCEVS